MFNIEGDSINISLKIGLDDVCELKEFLKDKLKYLEEVGVSGDEGSFGTSALLQLLVAIKHENPKISIKFLEQGMQLPKFGKTEWCYE